MSLQIPPDSSAAPVARLQDDRSMKATLHKIFCMYLPSAAMICVLILFLTAIVMDIQNDEQRFEEELEFKALVYLTLPTAFVFLSFGIFLFISCSHMDRGCFTSPRTKNFHKVERELNPRFWRSLEWMDFVSDVMSAVVIFSDFNGTWKTIIVSSLVVTFILNVALALRQKNDTSWKGRRRRLAISFAILGAEDAIMVPLNISYLQEEITVGNFNSGQEEVERAAVSVSTAIGGLLLVLRFATLMYHISCSLPDFPEEITARTKKLNPKVEIEEPSQHFEALEDQNLTRSQKEAQREMDSEFQTGQGDAMYTSVKNGPDNAAPLKEIDFPSERDNGANLTGLEF